MGASQSTQSSGAGPLEVADRILVSGVSDKNRSEVGKFTLEDKQTLVIQHLTTLAKFVIYQKTNVIHLKRSLQEKNCDDLILDIGRDRDTYAVGRVENALNPSVTTSIAIVPQENYDAKYKTNPSHKIQCRNHISFMLRFTTLVLALLSSVYVSPEMATLASATQLPVDPTQKLPVGEPRNPMPTNIKEALIAAGWFHRYGETELYYFAPPADLAQSVKMPPNPILWDTLQGIIHPLRPASGAPLLRFQFDQPLTNPLPQVASRMPGAGQSSPNPLLQAMGGAGGPGGPISQGGAQQVYAPSGGFPGSSGVMQQFTIAGGGGYPGGFMGGYPGGFAGGNGFAPRVREEKSTRNVEQLTNSLRRRNSATGMGDEEGGDEQEARRPFTPGASSSSGDPRTPRPSFGGGGSPSFGGTPRPSFGGGGTPSLGGGPSSVGVGSSSVGVRTPIRSPRLTGNPDNGSGSASMFGLGGGGGSLVGSTFSTGTARPSLPPYGRSGRKTRRRTTRRRRASRKHRKQQGGGYVIAFPITLDSYPSRNPKRFLLSVDGMGWPRKEMQTTSAPIPVEEIIRNWKFDKTAVVGGGEPLPMNPLRVEDNQTWERLQEAFNRITRMKEGPSLAAYRAYLLASSKSVEKDAAGKPTNVVTTSFCDDKLPENKTIVHTPGYATLQSLYLDGYEYGTQQKQEQEYSVLTADTVKRFVSSPFNNLYTMHNLTLVPAIHVLSGNKVLQDYMFAQPRFASPDAKCSPIKGDKGAFLLSTYRALRAEYDNHLNWVYWLLSKLVKITLRTPENEFKIQFLPYLMANPNGQSRTQMIEYVIKAARKTILRHYEKVERLYDAALNAL